MNERTIECDGEKWVVSLVDGGRSTSSAQGFHEGSSIRRLLRFNGPGSRYSMSVPKDTKLGDLSDDGLCERLKRLRGAVT